MKKKCCFFLLLILAMGSCNKTESPSIHPDVDVYIIGSVTLNTIPPTGVASYWKNNKSIDLSTSTVGYLGQISEQTTGIVISGNDIYISGYGSSGRNFMSGNNYQAKYWKNGVSANLTSGGTIAYARGIAISGSDVYVAGTETTTDLRQTIPKYWKNGVEVLLYDTLRHIGYFNPFYIAVSGADLYLAGYTNDTVTQNSVAAYWKNGATVRLSDGTFNALANAIALEGSDIFIAGNDGIRAVYWKNQAPVYLTNGSTGASAGSIAISGNDVYVAGNVGTVATYWKNGIPVSVGDNIYLSGIAVAGANVYVTGNIIHQSQPSDPGYWVNNVLVPIFDTKNYSSTSGILVVTH